MGLRKVWCSVYLLRPSIIVQDLRFRSAIRGSHEKGHDNVQLDVPVFSYVGHPNRHIAADHWWSYLRVMCV